MRALIFGATGMVGGGVMKEALRAEDVTEVLVIGRSDLSLSHPKLQQIVQADLLDYGAMVTKLAQIDACFFCLGSSALGATETDFSLINHDIPLAAATALSRANSEATFIYVSGAGTGTQKAMWARVKRKTETELLNLPFKTVCMFRPGVIQPVEGARSKTSWYRAFYAATSPALSLARLLFPAQVLSSSELGQAMLNAARHGEAKAVLEPADIRERVAA